MASTERKEWIDSVKGVGIMLVMLAHSCGIPVIGGGLLSSYMAMFFVVAGCTYKEKSHQLLQKSKRLLIPYVIFSLVCLTVDFLINVASKSLNGIVLVQNVIGVFYSRYKLFIGDHKNNIVFLGINNAPLWFLTGLFTSFVLFYFLHKQKRISRYALGLVYIVISVVLSLLPILLPWSLDTAFIGAIFIEFGVYIDQRRIDLLSKKQLFLMLLLLSIPYLVLTHLNGRVNMSISEYGHQSNFSVVLFLVIGMLGSVIYFIVCVLIQGTHTSYLLSKIGRNSIIILGLHLGIFRFVAIHILSDAVYILAFIQIACSIFVCSMIRIFISKLSKKIKILQYL